MNTTPPSRRKLPPEEINTLDTLDVILAAFKRDPAGAARAATRLLKEAEHRMLYGDPTAVPPRGIIHG